MGPTLLTLPDDVEALKALVRQRDAALALVQATIAEQCDTIAQLKRVNDGLSHRLSLALQRIYGRSSEKINPNQLLLFGQAMQEAAKAAEALADAQEQAAAPKERAKDKGHGRRPLPADLPRHRVEHAVAAEALICPCCAKPRVRIGEEVSEQLDYVPASLFVIQHVRPKLACPRCGEGVATAEKPAEGQVIEKGLPGPGLVAHVVTSKYADHQPLYRQEGILARHGVEIARSTMCGWMKGAAELLSPLVRLMATKVRLSKVIHTDDTPMPVQDPGRDKTRTGRLWVYMGDAAHAYTVFEYTPSRKRDGPAQWLQKYKGYLQADAFGGYDGIYATEAILEVACWAHARRKFYEARHSDPQRAHHVLGVIRLLYKVEREARELSGEMRLAMREARSRPLVEQLQAWLLRERDLVLPKSPLAGAIGYALNQWEALKRYLSDADLKIDNNEAERAIRPLKLGAKNYLFFGSDEGGRTGATLYSVVGSAKRHGLDPFAYLRDVLARIGSTPVTQLEQFLPDIWRRQQLEEIATG